MNRLNQTDYYARFLAVALLIGMLGAFKPVVFQGGSSMSAYLAKQSQLEMVGEEEVEDYFEAVLYGEGEVKTSEIEAVPESERLQRVNQIFLVDRWIVYLLTVGTLLLLFPKLLNKTPLCHVLPVLSLWLIVEAVGATLNGGKAHSEFTILAHATRWGLPLVLWWIVLKWRKGETALGKSSMLTHLMVVCTSITFAVHGWEALNLNPFFLDLIYNFVGLFHLQISPGLTALCLKAIGCMDLILAVLIVFYRRPRILLWMAFWCLITALSRPLTMGLEAWPEFAMRMANIVLPFTLWIIHKAAEAPSIKSPKSQKNPIYEQV